MADKQSIADGRYDSVAEFMAECASLPRRKENHDLWAHEWLGDAARGPSWFGAGCQTALDARRIISHGWPDGQRTMSAMLEKTVAIAPVPRDRRRRLTRCELGDNLDIHAVYRGQLDRAWTCAVRQEGRGPQMIDVCVNATGAWHIGAEELQWRGIAACVLVDRLQSAGYRVRVTVGVGSNDLRTAKGGTVSLRVVTKDHDSPLDVATAAAIAFPGFFRVPCFAWIIAHADGKVSQGICDASPRTSFPKMEPGEIAIGHDVDSESSALAFVESTIAALDAGDQVAA